MNKCVFIGNIVRDIDLRISQNENSTPIARFTIAAQRRFKKDGEPDADFINCICFGKQAETINKYFKKGMKIAITSRVQTGSYTNKEGVKVYTTDFVVEEFEFVESKKDSSGNVPSQQASGNDGFMSIPADSPEELPFQ